MVLVVSLLVYQLAHPGPPISMGSQLDGNFLPGSMPHKFILFVTLTICFVVNTFFSLSHSRSFSCVFLLLVHVAMADVCLLTASDR